MEVPAIPVGELEPIDTELCASPVLPHMVVHTHTVHLHLGALLSPWTMCCVAQVPVRGGALLRPRGARGAADPRGASGKGGVPPIAHELKAKPYIIYTYIPSIYRASIYRAEGWSPEARREGRKYGRGKGRGKTEGRAGKSRTRAKGRMGKDGRTGGEDGAGAGGGGGGGGNI